MMKFMLKFPDTFSIPEDEVVRIISAALEELWILYGSRKNETRTLLKTAVNAPPNSVRSIPTMCLCCHLVVELYHSPDEDPVKGSWQCPRCSHEYRFAYWKVRRANERGKRTDLTVAANHAVNGSPRKTIAPKIRPVNSIPAKASPDAQQVMNVIASASSLLNAASKLGMDVPTLLQTGSRLGLNQQLVRLIAKVS